MPLRLSLDWLQEYIELPEPAEDLANALTLSGTEVERIIDLGVGWDGVVVARILEAPLVPGSDHLKVLHLEVGEDRVQVVSGAPNISTGDLVPLARPGTTLPSGVAVSTRKFMGVASEGMVCSSIELGLSNEADGVLVLGRDGATGVPLSDMIPRDRVLVLETTTNRPDLLCHLGIARELSALFDRPLKEWRGAPSEDRRPSPVTVEVPDDDLCARYQARYLEGVQVGPAPGWMQRRLRAVGQRPISNVVDAANYVMLETAQPLHVFDFDRLEGGIVVRRARPGEELACLDGRTRAMQPDYLVIADGKRPVALAGIIGGSDSAVAEGTTRVVIESANFLGTSVRATSRRLGLRTEASTRFEKQLHPELVAAGAGRLVELLQEVAGAGPAAETAEVYAHVVRNQPISIPVGFVSEVLGDDVEAAEVETDLRRLGFAVDHKGPDLLATAPPFRLDVREPVDLVEEVGRLRGYESLPSTLPGSRQRLDRIVPGPDLEWEARDIAVGAGFDEVIALSLVGPDEPQIGVFPTDRVRLANPMSSDQDRLRCGLLPGLVRIVAHNADMDSPGARVFELGRVFWPQADRELPQEARIIGFAVHLGAPGIPATTTRVREALLQLKGLMEETVRRISSLALGSAAGDVPGMQPGRSLKLRLGDKEAGCLGQLEPQIAARLDTGTIVLAELDFEPIAASPRTIRIQEVSRHPAVIRDLAITVPELSPARDARDAIQALGEVILRSVELYDEYRGRQVEVGRKGLTFRLTFQADDRTLTGDEVAAAEARILESLRARVDAQPRL